LKKKTRGNRTQTPTREHINPTSAEVSFFERAILRDVCDLYTKLKAWREEREEKRLDFRAIGFKGIKKSGESRQRTNLTMRNASRARKMRNHLDQFKRSAMRLENGITIQT
jgi:hypothetical protein